MKKCIINFADNSYLKGQERLKTSLGKIVFDGDLLFWTSKLPPNSPLHDDAPWAFKVFAFAEAKRQGYELVLWIDSNGIAIRPLEKIFKKIERQGYYLWSRHSATIGEWSSDKVLSSFGLTRDQAFGIPEINAFCLGLNFKNKQANLFFERWLERAKDGFSFRGISKEYPLAMSNTNKDYAVSLDKRVKGHRHDQTIASIIAWQLKLKTSPYDCFDYHGEAGPKHTYSQYIPFNVSILQNRDVKSENFLEQIDKYGNVQGTRRRIFYLLGAAKLTLSRFTKDALKRLWRNKI